MQLELFLWLVIHILPLYGLPFWLWFVVVTLCLITGNDAIHETVTFCLILVQEILTNFHMVLFLLLCEYHGIHLVQTLQYSNIAIIISNALKLCTQLPDCNLLICVDELIEMSSISWCNSCPWSSWTWLVFHAAVATAEMHPLLPHCTHVRCLVSTNVCQVSVNVSGCNFFIAWRNSILYLCFIHTSVSNISLSDCLPLLALVSRQQNLMKYCQEGSISTVIVPTSTSDTEVQHNKKQDALLSEQPSQTPTRNKN